jgi:Tfp pilus assembly protein PilO
MSVRTRSLIVGAAGVLFALLWYFVLWSPAQSKLSDVRKKQETARQDQDTLRAQLGRLQALQTQEPKFRSELARLQDSLPPDPRLPDFILQIQEAASLAGVQLLTLSPSLPAPYSPPSLAGAGAAAPTTTTTGGGQLQSISVSITTTGMFFDIEDFMVRLEHLRRAMRIGNLTLSPLSAPTTPVSPELSVSFSLQMFLISPTVVTSTPGTTPSPSPGATATPAASPTASPAGAGG